MIRRIEHDAGGAGEILRASAFSCRNPESRKRPLPRTLRDETD